MNNEFIKRKRKLWWYKEFENYTNCFEEKDFSIEILDKKDIVLEVGAGNAQPSISMATNDQETNFIAVDIKSDRLARGATLAKELNLENIFFVRSQIYNLDSHFSKNSISSIWITFPDPYPKKSDARHRLVNEKFLKMYKKILKSDGDIIFKTDNLELFKYGLEQIVENGFVVKELSFNLHESDLDDKYKVTTYYEEKYLLDNIPINFVRASIG